jgi:cell division protein FtsI (penicillin-binding protein 3)
MRLIRKRRVGKARLFTLSEVPPEDAPTPVTGAHSRTGLRASKRIAMCAVAFLLAYGALAVRLAVVSFGEATPILAGVAPVRIAEAAPARPEILDRNGVLLATNLPMIALEIAGAEVWDPKETAESLQRLLPKIDKDELSEKLRAGRYVEAASDLTPAEQEAVFALGLPGVRFAARSRRFYPQGALAAHVIGHGEWGKGGVMGIEKVLNDREGALVSSIDSRVQLALEEEVEAALKAHRAEAAWGAVMNVETGEVLALVSLPDFDPNDPGAANPDWRRNRAVYDRYELGSAFKAFTAAAALDAGVATESSTYDAKGYFRVADRVIHDFHGENRVLSFSEVIQHSSNIGMARMAADLGPDRQREALRRLGLLDVLPIELPERRAPERPRRWGPVETATISYGHGISVTPLHLLAAYGAVVNGGRYVVPTFLKATDRQTGVEVFSARTSVIMRRVLRRVLTDGTAANADVSGYFPIGKTATADKPSRGGYNEKARIATFVGAFPGFQPEYAVLISLDDPQPSAKTQGYATAGWNAAPAFAKFVERAAPMLGVTRVSEATALAGFYGNYASASASAKETGQTQ